MELALAARPGSATPRRRRWSPSSSTQGLGVKRDRKEAAFWYKQAAEGGDPAGMFKYALLLMEGRIVPRDRKARPTS